MKVIIQLFILYATYFYLLYIYVYYFLLLHEVRASSKDSYKFLINQINEVQSKKLSSTTPLNKLHIYFTFKLIIFVAKIGKI